MPIVAPFKTESFRNESLCALSASDAIVEVGMTERFEIRLGASVPDSFIWFSCCSRGETLARSTLGMTGVVFGCEEKEGLSVIALLPVPFISCFILFRNLLSSIYEPRDYPPEGTSPPRRNSSAKYFSLLYSVFFLYNALKLFEPPLSYWLAASREIEKLLGYSHAPVELSTIILSLFVINITIFKN